MPNAPRAILAGRPILSTDLRADGNTFTAWRWTLALMVMFSHAWDLTQPRINLDPTVPILTVPISFVAVDLFFTLSGFLVAGSLIKRGLRDYALSRALRILPGLWVMLIVTTLAGLAFTTLPASDYLTDRETLRYLLINGSLAKAVYRLPGVFEQLPIPIVNGSLWTIPHEVRCYIVLALLGALGLLLSRRWFTALFALGAIVHCLVPLNAVEALDYPRRLGFAFFAGVLFYLWRQRVRLSWPVAAGGAVAAVLLAHSALPAAARQAAMQLAFGYLMFVAAFRAPPRLKAPARSPPSSRPASRPPACGCPTTASASTSTPFRCSRW